jgi:hypothetical protein
VAGGMERLCCIRVVSNFLDAARTTAALSIPIVGERTGERAEEPRHARLQPAPRTGRLLSAKRHRHRPAVVPHQTA